MAPCGKAADWAAPWLCHFTVYLVGCSIISSLNYQPAILQSCLGQTYRILYERKKLCYLEDPLEVK